MAVLFVGLALRIAWWAYADPAPVSDYEYYRRVGEAILVHHQYGYPQPIGGRVPGYSTLLAGLMLVSRSVAWLSFANVVLSAALPWLVYRLGLVLTARPMVGMFAALLCAINPTFVLLSPVLASEHLYAFLMIGALIALCSGEPRRISARRAALTGVLLAASLLTRPEALFYLPLVIVVAWWRWGAARLVAISLVVMVLCLLPWLVRNRVVIGPGAGLATTGGLNFYFAHNYSVYGYHPLQGTKLEGLRGLELQRRAYELSFEYIRTAGVRRLAGDVMTGTSRLFSISDNYAEFWSTRKPGITPDNFTSNELGDRRMFDTAVWVFNAFLFAAAASTLLFVRSIPPLARVVLFGMAVSTWFGYAVIFAGMARYRYVLDATLCVLAALGAHAFAARPAPVLERQVAGQ